jgi:hypothetical protein
MKSIATNNKLKKMNYSQKMNWLKENDPITYHELTSNPTGSESEFGCVFLTVFILFVVIILSLLLAPFLIFIYG